MRIYPLSNPSSLPPLSWPPALPPLLLLLSLSTPRLKALRFSGKVRKEESGKKSEKSSDKGGDRQGSSGWADKSGYIRIYTIIDCVIKGYEVFGRIWVYQMNMRLMLGNPAPSLWCWNMLL